MAKSKSSTFTNSLKNPKVIVALNLAVAGLAMLAPDDADASYGCPGGNRGDCEELTSNPTQKVCTEGAFWNDCY